MKALVYYGPSDMRVTDWKEPVAGEGEVLLRSKAVGICGSDVHGYLGLTGRRIPPMVMGHEVVAQVVENHKTGSRHNPGDLVFVDPISVCGQCANCKAGYTSICLEKENIGVLEVDGAFGEYFKIKEENLISLPAGISPYVAALAEPFSVAGHAIQQIPRGETAKAVAVIGAGVIGLCTAAVLHETYPEAVVVMMDLSWKRLDRCRDILGDFLQIEGMGEISYEEVRDRYTDQGFDFVFEAVGVEPTVNGALELVKSKGVAVLIGNNQKCIQMNYQQIVLREIRVFGTYGFTHEDLEKAVQAFSYRSYAEQMVDRVVPLEEAKEWFDELAKNGEKYLKIVVDPTMKHS